MTEEVMNKNLMAFLRRNGCIAYRVENAVASGLPDVIFFYKGLTCFIETKVHWSFQPAQVNLFMKLQPSHLCFAYVHTHGIFLIGQGNRRECKIRKTKQTFKLKTTYIGLDRASLIKFLDGLQQVNSGRPS